MDGPTQRGDRPPAAATTRPPLASYVSRRRPGPWSTLLLDGAAVAAVTAIATGVVFQLWDRSMRVPLDYDGDGLVAGQWIKTMIETGWVNSNHRLGAPFGQVYYDFPLGGDNLHLAVLRLMTLVSHDWALVMNVFFLLTFPAAAVSAALCLRWLGVGRLSRSSAASCSPSSRCTSTAVPTTCSWRRTPSCPLPSWWRRDRRQGSCHGRPHPPAAASRRAGCSARCPGWRCSSSSARAAPTTCCSPSS